MATCALLTAANVIVNLLVCPVGPYTPDAGLTLYPIESLPVGATYAAPSLYFPPIYALYSDVPQPSSLTPPGPLGAGAAGTAKFYVPQDGVQRQTVQRTTVITDVNGNWSVNWATSFQSATPTVNPIPLNPTAAAPYTCNVLTRSAAAATGKCWQTTSAANGLLGITISLGSTPSPSSTSVMVIGAEPTQ